VSEALRVIAPTVVASCGTFGSRVVDALEESLEELDPEPLRLGAYRLVRGGPSRVPAGPGGPGAPAEPDWREWASRIASAAERAASRELQGTGYRLLGEEGVDPGRPVRLFVVAGLGEEEDNRWCLHLLPALAAELKTRVSARTIRSCHLLPVLAFPDPRAAESPLRVVNRILHEARDTLNSRVFVLDTYTERSGALGWDQVAEAATRFLEAALVGCIYREPVQGRPETLPRLLSGEDVSCEDAENNPVWCALGVRCIAFPTRRVVETLAARGLRDFINLTLLKDNPGDGARTFELDPRDARFLERLPLALQHALVGPTGGRTPRPPRRPWGLITPASRLRVSLAGWLGAWSEYFVRARISTLKELKLQAERWRSTPTGRAELLAATETHLREVIRQEDYSLPRALRRLRALRSRAAEDQTTRSADLRPPALPPADHYEQQVKQAAEQAARLLALCPGLLTMFIVAVPIGVTAALAGVSWLAAGFPGLASGPWGLLARAAAVPLCAGGLFWGWLHFKHGAVYREALRLHRGLSDESARLDQLRERGFRTLLLRESWRQVRLVDALLNRAAGAVQRHLRYLTRVGRRLPHEDLALGVLPAEPGGPLVTRFIADPQINEDIYREHIPSGLAVAEKAGLAGRGDCMAATVDRLVNDTPPAFFRYAERKMTEFFRPMVRRDFLRENYWSRTVEEVTSAGRRMTVYLRPLGADATRTHAGTAEAVLAHPGYLFELAESGVLVDKETVAAVFPVPNRIYLLRFKYGIPFKSLGLGGAPSESDPAAP